MIKYLLLLASIVNIIVAAPLPINETNRVPWTPGIYTGVYGGIPTNRTMYTNLYTAGGDKTGVTNVTPLLKTLLDACPKDKYVWAPKGRYLVDTRVELDGSSDWSLIGESRNDTIFFATGSGDGQGANFVTGSWTVRSTNIFAPIAKGDSNVIVSGMPEFVTSFEPGNLIRIYSSNVREDYRVINTSGNGFDVGQVAVVISVANGTNITFWPPAYTYHPLSSSPRLAYSFYPTTNIGIENLTWTATNRSQGIAGTLGSAFQFVGVRNGWLKNVRIDTPSGYGVNLLHCLNMEVRDSQMYGALNSGASTAWIITTDTHASLYQNIFASEITPFTEINQSCGNVIGYNYTTNMVANDFYIGGPFDTHIPHSQFNLWEGNFGTMFQADGYFGSSSHNTLYRNRLHGYDPIKPGLPRAIDLCRWSTEFNIEGNILGSTQAVNLWFTTTNQFYSQTQPVVMRQAFPNPGNTSFATGMRTPFVDWRYPGTNRVGGVITNDAFTPTNILWGTGFVAIVAGDLLQIQMAGDTNKYYPITFVDDVTLNLAAVSDGTSSNVTVSRFIVATNQHKVFRVGADAYQHFFNDDIATHRISGNYDYTNNALIGTYFKTNSYYLPNGGAQPDWWVDEHGVPLDNWPPVNADGANTYEWPAAREFYYEPVELGPVITNSFIQNKVEINGKVTIQ